MCVTERPSIHAYAHSVREDNSQSPHDSWHWVGATLLSERCQRHHTPYPERLVLRREDITCGRDFVNGECDYGIIRLHFSGLVNGTEMALHGTGLAECWVFQSLPVIQCS